jgi:hypothetical protein
MKKIIFFIVVFVMLGGQPGFADDWRYLGQTPPGDTPIVFAPGTVSVDGKNTHALVISPDEKTIIFSRYPDGTSYIMTYDNNQWSGPVQSFFYGKEVSFTPDGNRIFYYTDNDIFYVEKSGSGWGAPVRLGPNVNTTTYTEYYPSIVQSQSLYFSRDSHWNSGRLMYSQYSEGVYLPAVDLGLPINNGGALHAWFARDESFVLFNSPRAGSYTELDIWASFRNQDGSWGNPKNLGQIINSGANAILCPEVSPDGKYLFFTKMNWSTNTGYIYWVNANLIYRLNCVRPPDNDFNGDCKVDFQDYAILAVDWLDCGLFPPEACNQ